MNGEIDIRRILPAIRVPTLLLHSRRDAAIDIGASRLCVGDFRVHFEETATEIIVSDIGPCGSIYK